MASLYKRGKIWYSNIRIGGKRIRRPLDTDKKLAEGKLAELIKHRADKRYGVGSRDISWEEWKKIFLPHSKSKRANTHKRDLAALAVLELSFPLTKLSQLTPELLDRFQALRQAAKKKPGTINRERGAIVAMARKAELWKYLPEQNWRAVKRAKSVRRPPEFFTFEQIRDVLLPALPKETREMWRAIVALGFEAGKRPSEVFYTAWSDVDDQKGIVWVRPHEDVGFIPKDYEVRAIPMTQDLRRLLQALPRRGRWILGPGRPASPGSMSTFFGRLVRRAGLTGNVNKLRHSFGSYLAMADTNLLKIRDLMGHANVKTTEIYVGLFPSSLASAITKLPQGLFKS